MNLPDDWWEGIEVAIAAMIGAVARDYSRTDPKTGSFSLRQFVAAVSAASTISIISIMGERIGHFNPAVTVIVAVLGSFVGIPVLVSGVLQVWNAVVEGVVALVRARVGASNGKRNGDQGGA